MVNTAPRGDRNVSGAVDYAYGLVVDSVRNVRGAGSLHGAGEAIVPAANQTRGVECRRSPVAGDRQSPEAVPR